MAYIANKDEERLTLFKVATTHKWKTKENYTIEIFDLSNILLYIYGEIINMHDGT